MAQASLNKTFYEELKNKIASLNINMTLKSSLHNLNNYIYKIKIELFDN